MKDCEGFVTAKLEVRNLFKVFGPQPDAAIDLAREGLDKDEIFRRTQSVVAVNDVSFGVREREIFVVMGLSGSGKSTLVRCLNRLIEPTGGSVLLDGEDVVGLDRERLRQIRLRKMSMVFQHFALFPHKTVLENAEYGLKAQGVDAATRREKATAALRAVGLDAWADTYPQALSGGMQQRVGLARGLAVEPEVLLMDEPFSALDPLIRREMQDELLNLLETYETTIIFITHDLNEALKLGHKIAIMKDGRFVQTGGPEDIVTAPADDYVAAFTQDVDRSRVLTIGSICEAPRPLVIGRDSIDDATARLAELDADAVHVVDGEGRVAGIVIARDLVLHDGQSPGIEALVRDDFPLADEDARLIDLFDQCASGLPIAVVDADGHLKGVVKPSRIFANLTPNGDEASSSPPGEGAVADAVVDRASTA